MMSLITIEILRVIEQNPRVTPLEISRKLKISTQYVRNTVRTLTELGLVETPVRGVYVITELGKYVLNKQTKKE
jgi:predicted transcriptional regulator